MRPANTDAKEEVVRVCTTSFCANACNAGTVSVDRYDLVVGICSGHGFSLTDKDMSSCCLSNTS